MFFLKYLVEMANSVDPAQTVPSGAIWSGSALFAKAILSETFVYPILGHLQYIEFFQSLTKLFPLFDSCSK